MLITQIQKMNSIKNQQIMINNISWILKREYVNKYKMLKQLDKIEYI